MGDLNRDVIEKARQLGTPFGPEAMRRLQLSAENEHFGSVRAHRSTDIAIFNKTEKEFRLTENRTGTGGWSKWLLPPETIGAFSSVVFGAQSHGFMTGATGCYVKYDTLKGKHNFWVSTSNPFVGYVSTEEGSSFGLRLSKVLANGNNNIVHYTIYNF